MLITDKGQTIRTSVSEIRETGRNAQGVKIMSVEGDERVVAVERLAESSADEGGESQAPPPGDGGGDDGSSNGGAPGGPSPSMTPPPGENDLN